MLVGGEQGGIVEGHVLADLARLPALPRARALLRSRLNFMCGLRGKKTIGTGFYSKKFHNISVPVPIINKMFCFHKIGIELKFYFEAIKTPFYVKLYY
jgi:hypothetical protein